LKWKNTLTDKLVIGTRGSQLALWQTNWVKSKLEACHPAIRVEVVTISTKGDRVLNVSLPKLGEQGKGLFTRELEEALLENRVDLAVHSLKDLPTDFTPGLGIGAICEREDVRDVLVARPGIDSFAALPDRARLGTSSLRRSAQILAARPDLTIQPVRGNVDTRLRKLDEEQYDGIILAAAGLHRLGRAERITEYLNDDLVLSAIGQGAIAIQTRPEDEFTNTLISPLDHEASRLACWAERAFLKGLGGGCLVPIAGLAKLKGSSLTLAGLVASPDGKEIIRGSAGGGAANAESIGVQLAEELLRRGADRLLARH
jgi:hydroxymethylbilane synthase